MDVPKVCPSINFDYYSNRVPAEFAAEVKDAQVKKDEVKLHGGRIIISLHVNHLTIYI